MTSQVRPADGFDRCAWAGQFVGRTQKDPAMTKNALTSEARALVDRAELAGMSVRISTAPYGFHVDGGVRMGARAFQDLVEDREAEDKYEYDGALGAEYSSCRTLRGTIGSALERLGYGWEDVSGMTLSVDRDSKVPTGLLGYLRGSSEREVPVENIAEVLDFEGDRRWGCGPTKTPHKFEGFSAVLWLPEHVVRFSHTDVSGEYIACDVTPIAAPEAARVDLSGPAAARRC
jgi:hypothetical protein